ncbi:MAG: hypothetical protein SF028_11445 [Candidatus Sumerlaeia bacterium]|nr:hypothetical protein [Candidatus Sumerlaeia bacterium]
MERTARRMDWDEIQRGRRRNWDKLKPPDERAREERERKLAEMRAEEARRREEKAASAVAAPAPPGYGDEQVRKALEAEAPKKAMSYHKRRSLRIAEERAGDIARFVRARKQSFLLAASAAALIATVYAVQFADAALEKRKMMADFKRYNDLIFYNERVQDFSTPLSALASWRGAWRLMNAEDVYRSLSPGRQVSFTGSRPPREYIRDLQHRMESGASVNYRAMSAMFEDPEFVRLPKRPWRDGELAIFRSPPFKSRESNAPPERLIAAVTYDRQTGEWRFSDMREAPYFSVKWTLEGMIAPRAFGLAAVRYDEKGDPVGDGESPVKTTADRLSAPR